MQRKDIWAKLIKHMINKILKALFLKDKFSVDGENVMLIILQHRSYISIWMLLGLVRVLMAIYMS